MPKANDTYSEKALLARTAVEALVRVVYGLKGWECGEKTPLYELLEDERFRLLVSGAGFGSSGSENLLPTLHYIRKTGKHAEHGGKVSRKEAEFCERALVAFREWVHTLNPGGTGTQCGAQEAVQAAEQTEVQATAFYQTSADIPDISEAETRRLFIDLLLKEAGWEVLETENAVVPGKACIEIELQGMPNAHAVGYADYVLFGADGKPLAVVEAKRTSVDPAKGRHQAELYAQCIEKQYGVKPVIYYTNGYRTFILDGLYPSREVMGFHSAEELQLLLKKRSRGPIQDLYINDEITNREYQKRAVKAVCEHFNSSHRRALLVMATGTGKTRTAISLVDVLTRNNWVKNVLFLADRTALVTQAHKNFAKLLPSMTYCVLNDNSSTAEEALSTRITLSTYQTMINYIDADDKRFTVGRYDLIIIDEAHRSVFGQYGSIFSYFDALLVGLTATPREEVARSTYQLFGMEEGEPNFAYELDEAVTDGYLVPFRAFNKGTGFMRRGIKYDDLSPEEKEQLEDVWKYEKVKRAMDPDAGEARDIESGEIFRYIFNNDTVDLVLQDLMKNGQKINDGELLGKTIIFAANHQHAQQIVDRFGALYPEFGGEFCRLIDNYVNYAHDLIDKFEVRGSMPQIAVSVDMLDVGIDIPDILNLVFFKPVKSKIKFWQMVGRGTRLSPGVFGQGRDKECFFIFDWCGNVEYFGGNPEGTEAAPAVSLTSRLFCLKTDVACELQKGPYQADAFAKKLHDDLKAELCMAVAGLNQNRLSVRKEWERVVKYSAPEAWVFVNAVEALDIKDRISPLLVNVAEEAGAKRFDVLVLLLELSLLDSTVNAGKAAQKIITIAKALQERASIPQVQKKIAVVNLVLEKVFWENLTLSKLENVRTELRELIKFLEGAGGKTFVTDIDDVLVDGGEVEMPSVSMSYKQKVFDWLKQNRSLPVLRKIENIEPLCAADIKQLEDILWNELGSKDEYERYVSKMICGDNVGVFMRSIVGVDLGVALKKFSELISYSDLNSMQEEYLKTIITYVCANGDISGNVLVYEPPFSDFDWTGVFGAYTPFLNEYIQQLQRAARPENL